MELTFCVVDFVAVGILLTVDVAEVGVTLEDVDDVLEIISSPDPDPDPSPLP